MDANKQKNFSDGISVLDQFNATGVPTGTPETSQPQLHPIYSKAHQMHNSSMDHRYPPIPHPPSTSASAYDFHNFDHKVAHPPTESVPVAAWSCTVCHKPYKTIAGLDRHVRAQHGSTSVNSNVYDGSKSHSEVPATSDRNKSCICTVCGNGFPYQSKLIQHMRVHTGKQEGLQSMPHNSNMKGPVKKYDTPGEKPFRCEYENCGKGFCRKDKLTRHMYIHTGERPFACSHCEKKFYRKDKLSRHERIHSDNKPPRQPKANASNATVAVKQEVGATPPVSSQAPPTTMVTSQYSDVQSQNRISHAKSSSSGAAARNIGSVPPQMLPAPADYIVCRFCGAQFSDRPTFDHHLLLHATLLGSKMPEPVKFYGSVPNA